MSKPQKSALRIRFSSYSFNMKINFSCYQVESTELFKPFSPDGGEVPVCPVCPVTLPIPAVAKQNVTDKSCLVCDKSEKYAFLVTLTPLGLIRRGQV